MADESTDATLQRLLNDKELRIPVMKALAKDHPETYVPELEVDDRISKLEASQAEKLAKLEADRAQAELVASTSAARAKLMADHHLDDAGVKAVEDFMVAKKIADYDSAIQFMELSASKAQKAKAEQREFETPDHKNPYWKNPRRTAREMARVAIAELQNQDL